MNTLQNAISQTGITYTIDTIRMHLNTPSATTRAWIVAEDIEDVAVYEKFVNTDKVIVLPSTDYPEGDRGCEHVENIVRQALEIERNANVIGIRDRDYTRYESVAHVFPDNIFATDERDVEMTLFKANSVREALRDWSELLLPTLENAIVYTRFMGYLRICNYICKLGCPFKRKVKLSKTWDDHNHRFFPTWKSELRRIFLNNCKNETPDLHIVTEEDLENFIIERGLKREPWENICQGHDTVWALSVLMVHTKTYSEEKIMKRMIGSYAINDFRTTQLYNQILSWAAGKGIAVFEE